jgi:hypothetical protein
MIDSLARVNPSDVCGLAHQTCAARPATEAVRANHAWSMDRRAELIDVRGHMQPMRFYLKGILALVILFLVTLMMAAAPEVNALRAMIVGGLVIVGGKMIAVRHNVKWPPKGN